MPADFKCVWFFESLQQNNGTTASSNVGWTETWYGTFDNIEQCLISMRSTAAQSYLGLRMKFMPSLYRLAWVRASEVSNPNRSKLAAPPTVVGGLSALFDSHADIAGPAQINCCVYVDFYVPPVDPTERSHHRRFLIRGIPLGLINGNIIDESGIYWTHLLAFCDYLGRGRAPMQAQLNPAFPSPYRVAVQNPATPFQPIDSLIIDPDNPNAIVVTRAGLASTLNNRFRIKSVRFPSFINRTWTAAVTVAAGGGIRMKPGRKQLAGSWDHTGQIQLVSPVLRGATQYVVIGLRNKKIGSPSKPTRGRRRAA